MRNLAAALLIVAGALATASVARPDPLRYGVADDWPKFHPCGDVWWQAATDIGYQDLRMTVQWSGGYEIPYETNIEAAVACAQLNGIQPILAIYPARPNLIGANVTEQRAFARFAGVVAQTFPGVEDFVIGNEPNVNRFWQPQYVDGQDAAGRDYEHTLARSYDAIKAVRPDAQVWAPAISSRGNDRAFATSNPSHSPVMFIEDMGTAYRASGRTRPIFDQFDMHPYPPVQDTDSYAVPFRWPQAGAANLDRVKQALWDAFHGTAQPTPSEQPVERTAQTARFASTQALWDAFHGTAQPTPSEQPVERTAQTARFASTQALPIDLDEVGSQTVVTGHEAAYVDGPESIHAISQAQQARNATQLMEIAACDPDVRSLLFFPLIDENDLKDGFQSGNLFADFTPKFSYGAVKTKIATAEGSCQGGVAGVSQTWRHATTVIGAQALFGPPSDTAMAKPPGRAATNTVWTFGVTAGEGASYRAGIFKVAGPSFAGPASGGSGTLGRAVVSVREMSRAALAVTGTLPADRTLRVRLPARELAAGYYAYGIRLAAAANPARTAVFFSRAFRVG